MTSLTSASLTPPLDPAHGQLEEAMAFSRIPKASMPCGPTHGIPRNQRFARQNDLGLRSGATAMAVQRVSDAHRLRRLYP